MSELALKLIAKNKAKHARGEDARVLDLGHCGIREIPSSIEECTWLQVLNFSTEWYDIDTQEWIKSKNTGNPNLIYTIPQFLAKLINLRILWLSGQYHQKLTFSDLTPISSLKNLESLSFSWTEVKDLSPLQSLFSLKRLAFSSTKVVDLSPLHNLMNLKYLIFHTTDVRDLSALSGLKNLENILCYSTQISDLSPLGNLKKLVRFSCAKTNVFDLSPIVRFLQHGVPIIWETQGHDGILVQDCPLSIPPPEIVRQGNATILRYFDERDKVGTDQIYEAKLILLGEGGAGKTTLCRKLFDPNAELPQEKDRTKGIDIHPFYFDVPGKPDKQFRLNIWDFAGQGKYQSAHSFFYTHRSLYVLVDDTRTLNENDAYRTLYNNWFQTAELFGGNSPVLVLHNEKDGCARMGFSLGGFQEHFDFVHGELFRINLGGGDISKLTKLKNRIQELATELPHIGDTVPKTWVKVREALETERREHPYITAERYCALCTAEGIADPERQSDLSHYFHDLGVFLHFQDNPLLKRDVFLQNQWVTDAVYKILDDTQIAGAQRGRFTPADLQRLWNESTYSERRNELLALMLQFELCYQVQDTNTYICPQLLPGDIPQYNLGADIPLQLKYEYVFMPKGLLYRLIVRLHRYIAEGQTAVWNAGVVLERAGAKAEITESLDRRTITVRATGLLAKELVTIINEEVERLHAPFGERLKVTVRIPCNCRICKGSQRPHFYDKIDLATRLMRGKATVECSVSYDDVPVKGLLGGVFVKNIPSDRLNANPTDATNSLNIFISYSKSDKEYLETAKKHLKLFERQGKLRVWDDTQLIPGEQWDEAIKRELAAADIILFLVSADLLATDYIWEVEMTSALARAEDDEVIVVPVIIRDCTWTDAPFGKFNALPSKGTPISTSPNADAAWKEVVERIGKIC